MAIYNEYHILEQQMLLEMHFSKKDLQDPATIDKILKKKKYFETVLKYVTWLFVAIDVIAGIMVSYFTENKKLGIGTSVLLGILLSKLKGALNALPQKDYDKNYKTYVEKVKNLIQKMEKAKEKDPENAEKYQKIIDNCKAVLKEIENRERMAEELKFEMTVDGIIDTYNDLKRYEQHPGCIGHTGDGGDFEMFQLAMIYGVPVQNIINNCIAKMKPRDTSDYYMFFGDDYPNNFSTISGKSFIMTSSDDEYSTFIIPSDRKMYYTDGYEFGPTDFYNEYKDKYKVDKYIIEFDKRMGFYKFSDCPENVKKKEFDLFNK